MAKIIAFDEEARRGMERGMNALADAVNRWRPLSTASDTTVPVAWHDDTAARTRWHRGVAAAEQADTPERLAALDFGRRMAVQPGEELQRLEAALAAHRDPRDRGHEDRAGGDETAPADDARLRQLIDVEGDKVLIAFRGMCAQCKISEFTMRDVVEAKLREFVSEDLYVEEDKDSLDAQHVHKG